MVGSHCRSDQLDQARSSHPGLVELARQEWSGWSTLLGIAPTSYPKSFDMSKKIVVEIEKTSAREAIGKWSGISWVDVELIGKGFFTLV